jgi:histidinol-phosphate aminotransferase
MERVRQLCALRDRVWHALLDQGWTVPRPQGNFVWLATGEHTARAARVFLEHGIVGRALGGDGIRVSIGEAESVPGLLAAASEIVGILQGRLRTSALD